MATGADVVQRMFDEWNAHRLDAVYAMLCEDYREYLNGAPAKTSRAEARELDQVLYELIPDYTRTVQELWGSGDRAVSRFIINGTMTDGRRFVLPLAGIFGVRDGLVAEAYLYFDPTVAVSET